MKKPNREFLNELLKEQPMAIDLIGKRFGKTGESIARKNYKLRGRFSFWRYVPLLIPRRAKIPRWARRQRLDLFGRDDGNYRTNILENGNVRVALHNGTAGMTAGSSLCIVTAWNTETKEPVIPVEFGIEKAIVFRQVRLYPTHKHGNKSYDHEWADKIDWFGPVSLEEAAELIRRDRKMAWDLGYEWFDKKNPLFLQLALEGSSEYENLERHPARRVESFFSG